MTKQHDQIVDKIVETVANFAGRQMCEEFPYATTGDVGAESIDGLDAAVRTFANEWIENNVRPMYFSGDWCEPENGVGPWEAYEAVRFGPSWNGWATPLVTRAVAERIVERQQRIAREHPGIDARLLMWHNDTLVVVEEDESHYADLIEPTEDGLYDVSLGWCWSRLDRMTDLHFRVCLSNGGVRDYSTTS